MPTTGSFCTPPNNVFYSKKPYGKLDTRKKEIRLVQVLKDDGSGYIRCKLMREVQLSEAQDKYIALSYCAGDPRSITPLLVKGDGSEEFHEFNAFANLALAISEACDFCRRHRDDEEPLLWVDQVCINQSDVAERSHQVGFMRDIYQHAREVIVCLSTDKSTSLAVDWLLTNKPELDEMFSVARAGGLSLTLEEQVKSWRNGLASCQSLERMVAEMLRLYDPIKANTSRMNDFIETSVSNDEFYYGWLGVLTMLGQPWWTRAWVYQEFMVCKDAQFLFGQQPIPWVQLSAALVPFIEVAQSHIPLSSNYSKSAGETVLTSADTPRAERIATLLERKVSVEDSMAAAKSMLESKSSWTGRKDFNSLLAHSRLCRASDPRDLVYAFIDLADIEYGIEPNYKDDNTVHSVFIEAAHRMIICSGNLDILSHAAAVRGHLSPELPSWVPDLTAMEPAVLREGSIWLNGPSSTPFEKARFGVSFSEDHRILHTKGIFVDRLEVGTPDISRPPQAKALGCADFKTPCGYVVTTMDRTATLSDEIWLLDGARHPFILRRNGNRHKLVCTTVVTHPFLNPDFVGWGNIDKVKAPITWKGGYKPIKLS